MAASKTKIYLETTDEHDLVLSADDHLALPGYGVILKDQTTMPGSFSLALTPDEARILAGHLQQLALEADLLSL
jgi:hypothetical protein